ncbi:MAG TPA: IclR family transcriptional regulator [Ilumatobacter sp.]|nr:IclR family transcriptional regulator [Ilumatobacter sp.]
MDSVTGVGVLDKSVLVMRSVASAPMNLNELQAATGLPRATAHRLAAALVQHGLLRRDPEGRFDLGLDLAALGRVAASRFPLGARSLPALRALRDDTGESVQLFVVEGDRRRCVVSLQSPHGLQWIVPEGVLFPLGRGSAGRVLSGETSSTGWVESIEEREAGVASVSAAVHDRDGMVIAAISVSGPVERLTRQPGERCGAAVIRAAEQIAVELR